MIVPPRHIVKYRGRIYGAGSVLPDPPEPKESKPKERKPKTVKKSKPKKDPEESLDIFSKVLKEDDVDKKEESKEKTKSSITEKTRS